MSCSSLPTSSFSRRRLRYHTIRVSFECKILVFLQPIILNDQFQKLWLFETLFYSCNSAKRAQKSHAKTTKSPQHCLICTLVSRDKISVTLLNPQKPTLKRLYLAALSANSNKKRIICNSYRRIAQSTDRKVSSVLVIEKTKPWRMHLSTPGDYLTPNRVMTIIIRDYFGKRTRRASF